MTIRNCRVCGVECSPDIGLAQELKTVYWGGKRTGTEYGPRLVSFFCEESHRNLFLESGVIAGERQNQIEIQFD